MTTTTNHTLFPIFKGTAPSSSATATTHTTNTMKNIWQALKRDYQLTNRSLFAAYGDQSTIDRLDALYTSDDAHPVRFVVITNIPIESEDRIVKLCNDARQGTFHAVLTLHGNLETQERDALQWKTESRYIDDLPDEELQTEQDLLLAMAAITDNERYRYKRKSSPDASLSQAQDDDYTGTWLNYEQLLDEMDAERRYDDFDDMEYDANDDDDDMEDDANDDDEEDKAANEDESMLDNYKSVPKKFVRGGASTQARAYVSDLYKQYFSSFYRIVKKTPKREALLVTAKMF